MPAKVFIIILNWNNWSDTLECLESLKNNDYPNYQVVIIDNGSRDDSVERLQCHCERSEAIPNKTVKPRDCRGASRLAMTLIVNQENLGFAGGNNVGIKYALEQNADYVLLLNNDTIVNRDFLSKLVEAGESNKNFGILGPKIYFYSNENVIQRAKPEGSKDSSSLAQNDKKIWSTGGRINWLYNKGEMRGWGKIDKGQYDQPALQETEFLTACCVLIKRPVIEKIGLMPEDYFLYYEDTDWSLQARRAGFKCIFIPSSVIWHKGSASSIEGSVSYIYYHIRNGLIMAQKYAPWYIKPFVHLDVAWRIIKQFIKWFLLPQKRNWVKYILLGIKDFYLGRRGKYENRH